DRPPRSVRGTLHSYLSRLRNTLGGGIALQSGGYRLTVDETAVDMHRFRRLVHDARMADDEPALTLFDEAMALWRGEPFTGLDTPWLASVRATLERERSAAQQDYVDVALRCGRHAALLPTLVAYTSDQPLDERAAGQLMLALYRSGRQADALNHYQETRQRLATELGTDPSPPLQQLHHQILTTDPTLTNPTSPFTPSTPAPSATPTATGTSATPTRTSA
ncbi:BTAD domain-containing putative transcriptional regulator, partial [Kibdelosporangium lantanae]